MLDTLNAIVVDLLGPAGPLIAVGGLALAAAFWRPSRCC